MVLSLIVIKASLRQGTQFNNDVVFPRNFGKTTVLGTFSLKYKNGNVTKFHYPKGRKDSLRG